MILRSLALFAVLSCTACGFQLRTFELDANIERAVLEGAAAGTTLGSDLRRALQQAGVELVAATAAETTDPIASDLHVQLLAVRERRRSISVTGAARAAEYELLLDVNYGLRDGADAELLAPRWLNVQRVYRVDRNNLVGSNEEENLLRDEMRSDAVAQILRSIGQVSQERGTNPHTNEDPKPENAT